MINLLIWAVLLGNDLILSFAQYSTFRDTTVFCKLCTNLQRETGRIWLTIPCGRMVKG